MITFQQFTFSGFPRQQGNLLFHTRVTLFQHRPSVNCFNALLPQNLLVGHKFCVVNHSALNGLYFFKVMQWWIEDKTHKKVSLSPGRIMTIMIIEEQSSVHKWTRMYVLSSENSNSDTTTLDSIYKLDSSRWKLWWHRWGPTLYILS